MKLLVKRSQLVFFLLGLLVTAGLVLAGCSGQAGEPGTSTGTLSGTVTNSITGKAVSGVTVKPEPAVSSSIQTDASGKYSATVPIGSYNLTFEKANFESSTIAVPVVAGETSTKDVSLKPTSSVAINLGDAQTAAPGGTVTLKATIETLDGATVTGYRWTQVSGVPASIQNASSDTTTVTLAGATAYKDYLAEHLNTLERFTVQAINPHSLEAAETAGFKITVTTSKGTASGTVDVTAELPYVINTGILNVPVKVPVLLHGKTQGAYSWTLAGPSGTQASLDNPSSQNPAFTPDVAGKYTLKEANSNASLDVYAGTWKGVITGKDANGLPVSDTGCTMCHNDTIAPDQFTAWAASGHAEILSSNIDNPTGHWSISCASCHSVGYDTAADNGGFDEAIAAEGWEAPAHPGPGHWDEMLSNDPNSARLANIQCENCHGPQDSAAHTNDTARVSLSSDVCGSCHGEPPRHGRFQQWEESKHGDYTLAIEDGTSASCARCHSAQGFLAYLPQLEAGDSGNLKAEITWTPDTVDPVTCVACHEPHDPGAISGEPNTATVRVEGNTAMLPAGFQATGVGRGAICMTCHNTRNGAHNDIASTKLDDRAPHVAAQTDVLMGQNAYFVSVGQRSPHSYIEDTCATCHMELSPPPAEFSMNGAGTNHAFEASMEICSSCHGEFNGGSLQEATEARLEELKAEIEKAIFAEIKAQTDAGRTVTLLSVSVTDASKVGGVELTESHGRMAMNVTVSGNKLENVRLASDTAVKQGSTSYGTLLDSASGQNIAKAGWNYFLLEGDASEGVHNPSFSLQVLNASMDALQ